ncbi:MAG: chorismate-binding protein [Bacteroidia bacterium]|nr:chorismate-binding protein [Bacteroidia bacterium]
MKLLSEAYPYWAYIPKEEHAWNTSAGLYMLSPTQEPTFTKEFIVIPYHFHSRESLFDKHHCRHFKIENYLNEFELTPGYRTPNLYAEPNLSFEEYKNKFAFIKSKLQRGDIYEMNFCMEFKGHYESIDPISLFALWHLKSQAPYSILFRLDNILLLCFSPELFLERKQNTLITRPIKGTLKKIQAQTDPHAIRAFISSEKERTENAMAVDVARNDFSRIALRSSLRVSELFAIKELKNIIQMYSTVECEIPPGINWFEILSATFPMASMTGAPKVSAMEVIRQTEDFNRGYYSGSIGIFQSPENATLNVVIRTLEYDLHKCEWRFCAGSAVTWKSEAEKEYEECLLKMKSIFE